MLFCFFSIYVFILRIYWVFFFVETKNEKVVSLPVKASSWTTSTLSSLNIFYKENATKLLDFIDLLKSKHTTQTTDEVLANQWKDFMKDWDFTFNFDIRRTEGRMNTREIEKERKKKIEDGIQTAEKMIEELQTEVLGMFQGQREQNDGIR